jgi:hypothetical protein
LEYAGLAGADGPDDSDKLTARDLEGEVLDHEWLLLLPLLLLLGLGILGLLASSASPTTPASAATSTTTATTPAAAAALLVNRLLLLHSRPLERGVFGADRDVELRVDQLLLIHERRLE